MSNKREYADIVLEFLKQKEAEKIEEKRRALFDFVGEFGDGESVATKSRKAIRNS